MKIFPSDTSFDDSSIRTMRHSLSSFSECTILVVGDVILDVYFMGEVRRLSPEAPVPIVRVKQKSTTLGGAGNVALNVAGLGCRAILLSVRGNDDAGSRLEEILRRRGIQGSFIVDQTRTTTSKTRVIGQGQQLVRLDEEETNDISLAIRDSLLSHVDEVLDEADVIILSDYDKGVLNGEMPQEIIRRASARGIPVLVDPKRKGWDRYAGATCVTPNTAEVEVVTGTVVDHDENLLVRSAKSLREQYHFEWCLVTRGPKGMCLVGQDGPPLFISATAREVFDVSGAGDTVIATLAAAIGSGFPFPKAAELSNMAAGIVVGKLGSQAITRTELETALHIDGQGVRARGGSKITNPHAAQVQIKAWQATGEKIVYTDGCFERLHPGLIHILQRARELGDRLVVGMESDASLSRANKTIDPKLHEQDRAFVLSALDCVDLVVLSQDGDVQSFVEILRPDILARGAHPSPHHITGRETVESYGGKIQLVPPLPEFEDS